MEKDKQIIKHSCTTQISNTISLLARKCWNVLLLNAWNDLKLKETFEIKAIDLMKLLEIKTRNYDHLEKTLTNLMGGIVSFNVLNKDKSKEWEKCSLLPYMRFINGIIIYQFEPHLQEKLISNEMYVKIKLAIQNKFTSKYSLALYELCLDYYDRKKEISYTKEMSIPQFRDLILGDEKKYQDNFKDLNKFVIKKIVKEVNELSDLNVKPIFKRWKRYVTKIQFEIRIAEKNKIGRNQLLKKMNELKLLGASPQTPLLANASQ